MSLHFFRSGKQSGVPPNLYEDQLHIEIDTKKGLLFLMNVAETLQRAHDSKEETFTISFAGELEVDNG